MFFTSFASIACKLSHNKHPGADVQQTQSSLFNFDKEPLEGVPVPLKPKFSKINHMVLKMPAKVTTAPQHKFNHHSTTSTYGSSPDCTPVFSLPSPDVLEVSFEDILPLQSQEPSLPACCLLHWRTKQAVTTDKTPVVIQTQEENESESVQSTSTSQNYAILANSDDCTTPSDRSGSRQIGEDDNKQEHKNNKNNTQNNSATSDPANTTNKRKSGNGTGGGSVGTLSSSDFNLSSLVGRGGAVLKNESSKEAVGAEEEMDDNGGMYYCRERSAADKEEDDCTVAMEGGDGGNSGDGNDRRSLPGGNGNGQNDNDDGDEGDNDGGGDEEWDDDTLDPFCEPKRACRRVKCSECGQYTDRCFEVVFGTYCLLAAVNDNEIGNIESESPFRDSLHESYFGTYKLAVHFYAYQQSGLFDIETSFAPPACMLQGSFRKLIDLYANVVRVRGYQSSVRIAVVESLVENGSARHPTSHWLTL